jgi:hypothetical protein
MSAMRLNTLIERLNAPTARLDVLVPKLEREMLEVTEYARECC